ncbi:MinD/ParA family protein [Candidatus Micrarchaeota archaeon]|nr:MinD/ParA family protein [Candidatus Micrarchaeota archaeon]
MDRQTIGIISGKGGVGKSTIAVNLATIFASSDYDNLLIDGDTSNPSVGLHLGVWQHSNGLQDVLAGKISPEEAVVLHPATGIRVIPSSLNYKREVSMKNLSKVVEGIKTYKCIIIDSPPGLSEEVENIMKACSELVVVTTPDVPSVTSATKIIDLAETHRVGVAGLVVNRILNKKYELHMQEIESLCNARIIAKIPEDSRVPESIAVKIPITMYHPNSPASIALNQLARELSGRRISQPQYAGVGIFGRFINFVKRVLGRV